MYIYCVLLFIGVCFVFVECAHVPKFRGTSPWRRSRREIVDDDEESFICCGSDLNLEEKEIELHEECFEQFNGTSVKDFSSKKTFLLMIEVCAAECLLKKEAPQTINPDGSINKEEFLKAGLDNFPQDDDLVFRREIITNSYDTCLQRAKDEAVKYKSEVKCDMNIFGLEMCLYRALETQCPAEKLRNSPICKEIRKLLEKDESLFLIG